MIPGRVARRVRVTTRNKLPLLPSSLFHRRTWRALAVLAVLTTNPFPFPFQAATIRATTTTTTTVRAFATGTSFPNRNRKQHERTPMPSNHHHQQQQQQQHKYQDSPTARSLASGRLESPSAERNKEPIWEVLSSEILSRLETNPSGEQQQQQQQQQPWRILEIAAGAGVHTEYMASRILRESTRTSASGSGDDNPFESESESEVPPPFVWYPTDPTEEALGSIRSRISSANLGKVVEEPEAVTLCASGICQEQARNRLLRGTTKSNDDDDDDDDDEFKFKFDVILCINMIHISPWEATLGLMKLAGEHLRQPEEEQKQERDGSGGGGSGSGGGYLYCYGPYRHEGKIVPSNENFDRSLKSRNPEWGVRNLRDVVDAANREGLELVDCIDMPANNNSLIFRCRKRL
mmetsp:Transcript_2109/g.5587  ORF Transcript_2109/g.5587 Transcript_2109/m.5587 type:complete len:406 (+) Transcript_2109:135-1352(+)